jgi:hypothetical protein
MTEKAKPTSKPAPAAPAVGKTVVAAKTPSAAKQAVKSPARMSARKPAAKLTATPPKANAKPAAAVLAVNKTAKPAAAIKTPPPVKPAVEPVKKPAAAPLAAPPKAAKSEKPPKADKSKKMKMVRDSFTMPENEYAQLAELKRKCLQAGVHIKKGELLRAGVLALSKLPNADLIKAVGDVEKLKTGRPTKR